MIKATHPDCRNYAPVDAVKGICHIQKKLVLMEDGGTCEHFAKVPKCKFCGKYTPDETEYLGKCLASPSEPMTYPDLSGVTCEQFVWKKD